MCDGCPNGISPHFSRGPNDRGMIIKEVPLVSRYSSFIQSGYALVKFVPVKLSGPAYYRSNQLIAVNAGRGCVVLDCRSCMYERCFDCDSGILAIRIEYFCRVPEIHAVSWVAVMSTDCAKDKRVCPNMFNHSIIYKFTCLTNIYLWTG